MRKISCILSLLFFVVFFSGCNDEKVTAEKTFIKADPVTGIQEIETSYSLNKEMKKKYDGYFDITFIQVANLLDAKAPEAAEYSWIDSIPPYNFYKVLECVFTKHGVNKSIKFTFKGSSNDPDAYETIEYISFEPGIDIKKFVYSKKSHSPVSELGSQVVMEKFELMCKYCEDQLRHQQSKKL